MKKSTLIILIFLQLFWLVLIAGAQQSLENARKLISENKPQEAVTILKQALRESPGDLEAHFLLGKAFLKTGQPDSAEARGQKLITMNGKDYRGYVLVSQALADKKRFSEALKVVKKGLKETKDNPKLFLHEAAIYLQADSTDKAIIAYTQARDIDPKNLEVYRGLYESYNKLGAEAMAILQLEQAIQIDSTQIDLSYKLGRHYYKNRRYKDAAKCYQRILKIDPQNDQAAYDLGQMYYLAKQYNNAVKFLEPFVARQKENKKAWIIYMESLLKVNNHAEAKKAAEHLLKLDPNITEAVRGLAKADYYLKDYNHTVQGYLHLEEIDTLSAEDYKLLGKSYIELKNDSMAIRCLEISLQKNSTQKELFSDIGAAHMRMKQWDKAANAYYKRIQSDTTYASAYINYALSNMALLKWDLARPALIKAIQIQPTYIKGHLYLARCLAQMDSTNSARQAYQKVIQLAKDQTQTDYSTELGEAYKMISLAYLVEKNYPRALEALTEAVKYRAEDVELRLWRAQTLHALDKRKEAEEDYQKVLKLDPNNRMPKRDWKFWHNTIKRSHGMRYWGQSDCKNKMEG